MLDVLSSLGKNEYSSAIGQCAVSVNRIELAISVHSSVNLMIFSLTSINYLQTRIEISNSNCRFVYFSLQFH